MSALKYLFDKPMSTVLSAMSVLIYFVSKMSALKYLFDKPISTVLSEMSALIMCVCTCVCTCGKAVVLPVLHKIIINKDDTNFYCNLNRYLMQSIIFYKENRYKKP